MKGKIKNFLSIILAMFVIVIIVGFFFLPLILSIVLNNWWFILLFAVSWIPALGVTLGVSLILNILDI